MENKEIKIFVACHSSCFIPDNKLLYPIQAGSILAKQRLEGMIQDDLGDNISHKNKHYCELTAIYWIWKNVKSDYYGLFHYRRYFDFAPKKEEGLICTWNDISAQVYDANNERVLKAIGFNEKLMRETILNYDLIIPTGSIYYKNFKDSEEGKLNRNSFDKHYKIALKVLAKKYPHLTKFADQYDSEGFEYLCNMFIMKKELFNGMCEYLFNILDEVEPLIDYSTLNDYRSRMIGFLAERLTGVYYLYLKSQGCKTLHLDRAVFRHTEVGAQ